MQVVHLDVKLVDYLDAIMVDYYAVLMAVSPEFVYQTYLIMIINA